MIALRIFRTGIRIEFSFLVFFALIFITEQPELLIACTLHELGHLTAMWFFGVECRRIIFSGVGIRIVSGNMVTPFESLIILISGLAVNFLCFLCGWFQPFSLLLLIFNMMPFSRLDGGCIIISIGEIFGGERFARGLLKFLSVIIAIIMIILIAFLGENVWIGASIILYYCFYEIFF